MDIHSLGALTLLLIAALWFRYDTARRVNLVASDKGANPKGTPPTFPYVFPLLGSLPISYIWDPRAFVLDRDNFFQSAHPVLVKMLTGEFYIIRGPENVKALFKNSGTCTTTPFMKLFLGSAFRMPAKALSLYDKDDSGDGLVPHPNSHVEARNRIDYWNHQTLRQLLEGKGLLPFWNRFSDNITQQLCELHGRIGTSWEYRDDLMKVVRDAATVSILNSLCGPYLLSLNPNFLRDYWEFDRKFQTYVQGIPWFLAPRAYMVQRRVLNAVKVWQKHARDHFVDSAISADGDDPFWGSSFFRERDAMFLEMDGFDYDAMASKALGTMWAARNSINASSWVIFEIYRDPELLASIRAEVDACVLERTDSRIWFEIDQLLHLPILQAVYAETLRLRMHFYMIRMPDRQEMDIGGWLIPRRKVVVTTTTVAHMDTDAWSTGSNNEHPIDQFWVGRFLRYPSDSNSGSAQSPEYASSPVFSTEGLEGAWIPYGGGPRQCPGRHFSKRQILLTTALMVSLFDCDISDEGKGVQGDFTFKTFGDGVSHPAGKVPMRIRRRDRSGL